MPRFLSHVPRASRRWRRILLATVLCLLPAYFNEQEESKADRAAFAFHTVPAPERHMTKQLTLRGSSGAARLRSQVAGHSLPDGSNENQGVGPNPVSQLFRTIFYALVVAAGLVALLYATSAFERLMDRTTGLLSGQTPAVAGAVGLAVGALHTFAGPDHLAGLAPLVIEQRRSPLAAFGLGALWGSGHATGQLLIGLGCLLVQIGILRMAWAPAFGQASGVLVGASLVAIGLLGFYESKQFKDGQAVDGSERRRRFGFATYATGVLHGLSPDAIIFIVPALALPRFAAALHVAGVVAGTLLAMGGYTALLSALCQRSPRLKLISRGASSIAVLLGLSIFASSLGLTVALPGL
eukprot:TRINITY_DN18902_c0_g1_i1.p1 TRINITY_DN18902_c0_g1~~TRINITY_DN18902_c0_g1_i1.p1  ORF type:complete len:353 (-),score=37.21 TRINITY_DN18902_c0_g1_i1:109-1167(-)